MNIIKYPSRSVWKEIIERPHLDIAKLNETVTTVLNDIRHNGDKAVKAYEKKFDHVELANLQVSPEEREQARKAVPKELKDAITLAHDNIRRFHEAQRFTGKKIETCAGVTCWQKSVPIERVGLYIPGGTAPLFSTVLMLATPARIAGCKEIILCSPPDHEGHINPAILVAADIAGVHKLFKVGGVQAIGAMAYGTESIPKVYKIFGPGNQYVMAAKQHVAVSDVAIDMPAGPSEVCVIADDKSNPVFVAADLLSQAEHGRDSQVLLISTSATLLDKTMQEINRQIATLPRRDIAKSALENSHFVLVHNDDEAIDFSNAYAPEHLVLCVDNADKLVTKVINAGSVFLGPYACESAGDYASGTNHTLPTHGYAKAYNGVNLDSYCRKITFQQLTAEGIRSIGHTVEVMAEAEQLQAHKRAMTVRIDAINQNTNKD